MAPVAAALLSAAWICSFMLIDYSDEYLDAEEDGRLEVARIRLDARQKPIRQGLCERAHLSWVAERRARAMRLDAAEIGRGA